MRPGLQPGHRLRRWRHALGHSIQARLMLLFVMLALASSAVFVYGLQRLLQNGWQAYARPLVVDYTDRLAAEIGSPPDVARARALVALLPITIRIEGPLVGWDSQTSESGPRIARHERRAAAWGLVRDTPDGHRISFGLLREPDDLRPLLIGLATLAALLLLTAVAYLSVRRLLAPLAPIAAGVAAYGHGDFSQPIRVRRRDELGFLAEHINAMAASLGGMLEAKRALLLAISHELRSPLTRARINAELIEEGEPRSALLRDLGEMRDLITSLLESERLAQGHEALQPELTDVALLVRELVATQFGGATLTLALEDIGGPLQADPVRLRLLLRNLIDNALRHSNGVTAPVVLLRREADDRVALGVRDVGPGVAPGQLAQLGQAFYRPDASRTRAGGGTGLGLYLCRLVAQAHGGELRIRAAEPGLEVCALWLPVRAA